MTRDKRQEILLDPRSGIFPKGYHTCIVKIIRHNRRQTINNFYVMPYALDGGGRI